MDGQKIIQYVATERLLQDRVILITGCGAGLGRALAKQSARLGATVILHGRTRPGLQAVYEHILSAGGPEPMIYPLDLERATERDYEVLRLTLHERWGRLDGLVQNAGILGPRVPIMDYDSASWQRVLQVNLTAPFLLCRSLLPLLLKSRDASLLFTSSGVGRRGKACWGGYAVSKFGIEGLCQVLADELKDTAALRANVVNPGATRTAMRASAYPSEDSSKLKSPHEVLAPYLFLLGPDSRGVSGFSFDAQ